MLRTLLTHVLPCLVLVAGCQATVGDSYGSSRTELWLIVGEETQELEIDSRFPGYDDLFALEDSDLPWTDSCPSGELATGFELRQDDTTIASTRLCANPDDAADYLEAVLHQQDSSANDDVGSSQSALYSRAGLAGACAEGSDYHCCRLGGGGWDCIWLL